MSQIKSVFVTGGAGYVGSVLIPKLVAAGYRVKVLDLYIYGDNVLKGVKGRGHLAEIKGDLRDQTLLRQELQGMDAVIHLACISNDPSYELNPDLGKSINYDAFLRLADLSIEAGVKRFIYASSSSVYGVKKEDEVTESLALEPLTDYSKYKALCEDYLLAKTCPGFTSLILRPATVCGYSPRLRLDLTVNILTTFAMCEQRIKVFGGSQMRPNIHIEDMTDLYVKSLLYPDDKINGRIYNAGYENYPVREIALMVQKVLGKKDIKIETVPTNDNRSYRISSEKIKRELGFEPSHSLEQAVQDLKEAFIDGRVKNPMTNRLYYNIRTMKEVKLSSVPQ